MNRRVLALSALLLVHASCVAPDFGRTAALLAPRNETEPAVA